MQWSDQAIVLSSRKLGENSGIISLLTEKHGLYRGVDRGAFSKPKRGIYQTGNRVSAHWQARLSEQLGAFTCELTQPVAASLMYDKCKLAVISSAAALIEKILPERENHAEIYAYLDMLLEALYKNEDYLKEYVKLELRLLSCSGFGIDLERCAATGQTHDLVYVSPKSGRAVSKEAGDPYRDRLLKLPDFLDARQENAQKISAREILAGIQLCGHFLRERIFNHPHHVLPSSRVRLARMLEESALS